MLQFHNYSNYGHLPQGDKFRSCVVHVWPWLSSSGLLNGSMGSALEGGLIALAGPGAPRLAPTVYQFVAGASGRVVLCGCHPVASFTQASIRRVWELRVRCPSLLSTPGTCRDSVTSCECMEYWERGTGSWIQLGNHFVATNVTETGVSTNGYPYFFRLDLQECSHTQYHVRDYLWSLSYSPSAQHLTHAEATMCLLPRDSMGRGWSRQNGLLSRAPLFHELHRCPCPHLLAHMWIVERKLNSSHHFVQ